MNDFTQANAQILKSVAERVMSGQWTSEEANRFLNTCARFEERVEAHNPDQLK